MERLVAGWDTSALLGPPETEFIAARDGFYLGTVGQDGWPYVQYRGGPPGFLHVLEPTTTASRLAWADFRGNRQYLSVGNLAASPRVSLFLMDYAGRQRLKILGEASVADVQGGDPATVELAQRLTPPDYPARVERVISVEVVGFDWNCPQHITQRWSREELTPALAPLRTELEQLRRENADLRIRLAAASGPAEAGGQ